RDKMIALVAERGAAAVIEQMLPKMLSDETRRQRPQVSQEVLSIAAEQAGEGVINALKALRDRTDARPGVGSIGVPTLGLVGAADGVRPPPMSETLAKAIAGARLEKIPGAGHLSNMERPDLFNQAVQRFLNELR